MKRGIRQNERLQRKDVYDNYNSVLLLSLQFRRPHPHPKNRRVSGFSLLEALTVICLIGICSSVALGWYGGDNRAVIERLTHQRNAQEIVSLGVCATMGGADFVVPGDKHATAVNHPIGVAGRQGVWKDKLFRLTNLGLADLPGALTFVKFDDDLMLYDPAGLQP
ncbi:MAG: hypothetical protein JWR15_678 [Prosthecobacter sp.]|nr:hypothetical protein [Prosthecobacter sp.]